MKKKIFTAFSFIFLITSIFADKSRYYHKDDIIVDIMYVTSEEGLRVRDKPDELAFNIDNCALNDFNTSGKYAADYSNYWHPIIIEHQKKADAME